MLSVVFTIAFVVGTALGNPSANQYVDNLLSHAYVYEVNAFGLDPAALQDFSTEFEDTMMIIGKVKGKADFTNGNMSGLSEAKRHSECQVTTQAGLTSKAVNCTIIFEELKITYDGRMKYGKMPTVGINAKGKVKGVQIAMEVIQTQPMLPTVKTFSFVNLGTLKAKFNGLGPLNRFTKALEDGFKSHVQAEVLNSINLKLQYALNRAVSQTALLV